MRKIFGFLLVVVVAAGLLTAQSMRRSETFLLQAARATLANEASVSGSKCPLNSEQFETESPELLSICVAYGLKVYVAAHAYPTVAIQVLNTYGGDATFLDVLDEYGGIVFPVTAYFVTNGSGELRFKQSLGDWWQQFSNGEKIKLRLADISNEQIGLLALYEIKRRGHEMLAEFEIVDGVAKRKPGTRLVLGAKDLLFGGLTNLEKVLVRGEKLTKWDIGMAALDATILVGAAGGFAKVLKVGKVVGKDVALVDRFATLRLASKGVGEALITVGKVSVKLAPVALLYGAIMHPSLLASGAGWIAEMMGFNPAVGIFAWWFLVALVVVSMVRKLVRITHIAAYPFVRVWRIARHIHARK
jgi:hypothetical protein